jgi:hypothetical protein
VIFSAAAAVCLSNSWAPENRSWVWRTKKLPLSQFSQLSAFLKVPNLVSCLNQETPSWADMRVQLVIAQFSVCFSLFSLWHQIKLLLRQINDLPHWQASEGLTT